MTVKSSRLFIILSVVFSAVLMSFIDGFIAPPYFLRSAIKIALFLIIPLIYFTLSGEKDKLKQLFKPEIKNVTVALPVGIAIYVLILAGYFLLKNQIDLNAIKENLAGGMGVNKENFVFISLYIAFINSLLEEFFFRGFAFLTLEEKTDKRFAYIFSSLLFAFYHVGMTSGWFNPLIYLLSMAGLFAGGCIFNHFNKKCGNIYTSWIIHMFCNFAINTVGFILFGII